MSTRWSDPPRPVLRAVRSLPQVTATRATLYMSIGMARWSREMMVLGRSPVWLT